MLIQESINFGIDKKIYSGLLIQKYVIEDKDINDISSVKHIKYLFSKIIFQIAIQTKMYLTEI